MRRILLVVACLSPALQAQYATTAPVSFGDVAVGSSLQQNLVITSVANNQFFQLLTVTVDSNNATVVVAPGSYTLMSDGNTNILNVPVTFTPVQTGLVQATLQITLLNSDNVVQQVILDTAAGNGIDVSLTPSSLDFGSVNVGTTSAPLSLSLLNQTSSSSSGTAQSSNPSFVVLPGRFGVSPGGTQNFTVTFTPATPGPITATITILLTPLSVSVGSTQTLTLSVKGTGLAPQISVSPSRLDFGTVQVGTTSAPLTFSLSNPTSLVYTGTGLSSNSGFAVTPGTFSAAANGTQIFNVTFTPTGNGPASGTITLTLTPPLGTAPAPPVTLTVAVTGTGAAPRLSLSPKSLDFGSIAVGSSAVLSLIVSNPATFPVTVTASSGDPAYTLSNTSFLVGAGSSTTISVTFTPPNAGTFSASASFSVSATTTVLFTVPLAGKGVTPVLAFSTSKPVAPSDTIDLGSANVGSTNSIQFHVSNPGAVPSVVTSISSTGGSFSVDGLPALPVTLAPAASDSFNIHFKPAALGKASGTLTINGEAFNLAGTGTAPPPPSVTLLDVPQTVISSQQASVGVELGAVYPLPINGTLTIQFTPDVVSACANPPIVFEDSSTSLAFTIPAGQKKAAFQLAGNGTAAGIQFGNVAGRVDLITRLSTGGADITPSPAPTASTTISRLAPSIATVTIANKTATNFDVVVTGDSTPREITQAAFTLTAAAGSNLQTTSLTVPVRTAFSAWYGTAESCSQFGSSFKMTQQFSIQGNAAAIGSVSVKLTNSTGDSIASSANF